MRIPRIFVALACWLASTMANAQTFTSVQWGMNRASPTSVPVCIMSGSSCLVQIGTANINTGVWSIPSTSITGTSGGIPFFNSSTSWASTALLAANSLMIGGGAGVAPSTITTGTGVLTALGLSVNGSGAIALTTSPVFVTPTLGAAAGTSLAVTNGLSSSSTATAPFVDGIWLDYTTGTGRFSVGPADGFCWYNGATLASTQLACLASTGAFSINSAAAAAFSTGPNGATNPSFSVDASTLSAATGIKIKSAAAGGGVAVSATTSGVNENLTIDAVGSGTITLNGTATGAISTPRQIQSTLVTGTAPFSVASTTQVLNLYATRAATADTTTSLTLPQTVAGTVTSGGVPYFNSTTQMSSSALLAANALVVGGGAGLPPATTATGTGVVTALGVNVGTAGSVVVNGGVLGTPSSGTLTNATGLPISTGVSGLGTGVSTALGVNVGTAGAFVVNGGVLGTPSSGTLTNATGLPLTTGVTGTLPVANGGTGLTTMFPVFQGRLSLQSGTPVMTTSTTGGTVVYLVPYGGRYVTIYDGTNDKLWSIGAQLSMTLGTSWAANNSYDVFVTLKAGVPTLCTVAWTNLTTRAAALDLGTRGYYTNSAASVCQDTNATTITLGFNQASYLGTFYTNGSTGQVDYIFGSAASGGGASSLGVWNYYNRMITVTTVVDNGVAYTYNSATIRACRASNTNRITFIQGVAEEDAIGTDFGIGTSAATLGSAMGWGAALDSTTAFPYGNYFFQAASATALITAGYGVAVISPQIGQHYLQCVESSSAGNNNQFDTSSNNYLSMQIRN